MIDEIKSTISALTPKEITAFNQCLKSIRRASNGAAGLIVVSTKRVQRDDQFIRVVDEYWTGQYAERFDDDVAELPYVYVSIKKALERAESLNEDEFETNNWTVMFWKHPDYYLDQSPVEKYLKMTGICYSNSTPRN